MTRDEAVELLRSASPYERVKAARYLSTDPEWSDLRYFQESRARESVSYVKAALDLAISRARDKAPKEVRQDDEVLPSEVRDYLQSRAVKYLARQILHELGKPIGLVALSASQEVRDYDRSKTKGRIERLQRTFEAIEFLQTAATAAKPSSFDLAELIRSLAFQERDVFQLDISLQGRAPFPVVGDKRLIELALSNGVRNALEAVKTSPNPLTSHPVIITWGDTDVDYWISVLDTGPGLGDAGEELFLPGRTSKEEHVGFGLTIARQAMQSMNGTVHLQNGTKGGTRFELRWGR